MAKTGKSSISGWKRRLRPPCCSRIPSSCSNKDELEQCNSWLRWAWERKIWWQEKWLCVLAFLSFQCEDMWKGLSLTERPSHILLWQNLQAPNNITIFVFPDVIGICVFSHCRNLSWSSHTTALVTEICCCTQGEGWGFACFVFSNTQFWYFVFPFSSKLHAGWNPSFMHH